MMQTQPDKHDSTATALLANCFAPAVADAGFPKDAASWLALTRAAESRGLCGLVLERARAHGVTAETAGNSPPYRVLERARAHGVTIPTDAHRVWLTGQARVAAHQLHQTHELTRLLKAFDEAGVPVMLLKGAALTQCLYDEAGLRPMSDVDLLVRQADVGAATRVLRETGCRRGADLVRDDFFPRFYYETEWVTDSSRPVRLDFHVRPLRPLRIALTMPEDALWLHAERVDVGGAPAWIASRERMFIHLAAHAAYHGCSRLIWLYDLRRFYERYGDAIDWSVVLDLCRRWRLSAPVRYAIQQCRSRVGDICPSEVARALDGHRVSWRDRLVLWQSPRDSEQPLRHVFVNAITTPNLRYATAYVLACVRPNDAHLGAIYRLRHPGWRVCAHLLRGVRAVARAVGGIIPLRPAGLTGHHTPTTASY